MAIFTRVCCCDIKIAVMILAILTLITSGVNAAFTAFSAVSIFFSVYLSSNDWMIFVFNIYLFSKNSPTRISYSCRWTFVEKIVYRKWHVKYCMISWEIISSTENWFLVFRDSRRYYANLSSQHNAVRMF